MVSLYHISLDYVRWWPQMYTYGVYKEFGEVMKTTKYSKLPDVEKKYEADQNHSQSTRRV